MAIEEQDEQQQPEHSIYLLFDARPIPERGVAKRQLGEVPCSPYDDDGRRSEPPDLIAEFEQAIAKRSWQQVRGLFNEHARRRFSAARRLPPTAARWAPSAAMRAAAEDRRLRARRIEDRLISPDPAVVYSAHAAPPCRRRGWNADEGLFWLMTRRGDVSGRAGSPGSGRSRSAAWPSPASTSAASFGARRLGGSRAGRSVRRPSRRRSGHGPVQKVVGLESSRLTGPIVRSLDTATSMSLPLPSEGAREGTVHQPWRVLSTAPGTPTLDPPDGPGAASGAPDATSQMASSNPLLRRAIVSACHRADPVRRRRGRARPAISELGRGRPRRGDLDPLAAARRPCPSAERAGRRGPRSDATALSGTGRIVAHGLPSASPAGAASTGCSAAKPHGTARTATAWRSGGCEPWSAHGTAGSAAHDRRESPSPSLVLIAFALVPPLWAATDWHAYTHVADGAFVASYLALACSPV